MYILFYELRHAIQYNDTTLNLKNYRMAKEEYIQTSEEKRISQLPKVMQMLEPNYYYDNHDYFEFEIDADIYGFLYAYELLNHYNFKEYNDIYNKNILEKLSNRNTREYYDIENKFDDILDSVKKPFDIEYNSFAKRKTFEELMNNNLSDQNLYNKLLLNKIKEEEIAPGDLKYIIDNEINKLKYDIAFQKALEKDYYFFRRRNNQITKNKDKIKDTTTCQVLTK